MAWGKVTGALGVVAVAAIGVTIYAWGAGWFWPCETLGRPFSAGTCEKITTITDRSVGPFALLPSGNDRATFNERRDALWSLCLPPFERASLCDATPTEEHRRVTP